MLQNMILLLANNKSADEPAHLRSLISVSVFRFLESITTPLAIYVKFEYSL